MTTPDADLRKVQKLLTLILAELDRVCRRIGVSYAIYGGTAIGAIRHGGFIPWDDDIDVMMTRADYERFLAEAPALLDERFRLDNTRTREDFPLHVHEDGHAGHAPDPGGRQGLEVPHALLPGHPAPG